MLDHKFKLSKGMAAVFEKFIFQEVVTDPDAWNLNGQEIGTFFLSGDFVNSVKTPRTLNISRKARNILVTIL